MSERACDGLVRATVLLGPLLVALPFLAGAEWIGATEWRDPAAAGLLLLAWGALATAEVRPAATAVLLYLFFWYATGNLNFAVFREIWSGWDGDIELANRVFAAFIATFAVGARVFPARPVRTVAPLVEDIDARVLLALAVLGCLVFAAVALPVVGWTGIYGGKVSNETRFDLVYPGWINRLALAFPLLAMLLWRRVRTAGRPLTGLGLGLAASFFVLTAGGARWGFFQLLCSLVAFAYLLEGAAIFRRFALHGAVLALLGAASQPVLAVLRNGGSVVDPGAYGTSGLEWAAQWGGEYRDGAAALLRFTPDQVARLREGYVQTLVLPVVPRQLAALVGIDKERDVARGAAFVMQEEYGIASGAIRVGGVIEVYLFAGFPGVVVAAMAVFLLVRCLDSFLGWQRRRLSVAIALAVAANIPLYFPVAQGNVIFVSVFAMASLLILSKIAEVVLGRRHTVSAAVARNGVRA